MRLGKCIDLTVLSPSIVEGGGADVTWTALSATHGTCVIHFPPGRDCPGGDAEAEIGPYGSCSFKFQGCGRVHVAATGTSGAVDGTPNASSQLLLADGITLSTQPSISMAGGAGGDSCDSTDLSGDGDVIFNVTCGMTLILTFDGTSAYSAPECEVTFDVEVYS